jgi:hypothetical protein
MQAIPGKEQPLDAAFFKAWQDRLMEGARENLKEGPVYPMAFIMAPLRTVASTPSLGHARPLEVQPGDGEKLAMVVLPLSVIPNTLLLDATIEEAADTAQRAKLEGIRGEALGMARSLGLDVEKAAGILLKTLLQRSKLHPNEPVHFVLVKLLRVLEAMAWAQVSEAWQVTSSLKGRKELPRDLSQVEGRRESLLCSLECIHGARCLTQAFKREKMDEGVPTWWGETIDSGLGDNFQGALGNLLRRARGHAEGIRGH